jgi:hypothetical protein
MRHVGVSVGVIRQTACTYAVRARMNMRMKNDWLLPRAQHATIRVHH